MKKIKKGSGLIFAVVLLFVILAMVVTLSSITVLETKMSQKTKSSVTAFYNSETGVEWALNIITSGTGKISSATNFGTSFDKTKGYANCPKCPTCSTPPCRVYLLDTNGNVITSANANISTVIAVRSVGTQNVGDVTQRAIEATVASGGESPYFVSCFDSYYGPTPPSAYDSSQTNQNCCQIDSIQGAVKCRYQHRGTTDPWKDFTSSPWGVDTIGRYRLSCWAQPLSNDIFCCRSLADSGNVQCKKTNAGTTGGGSWAADGSPFSSFGTP